MGAKSDICVYDIEVSRVLRSRLVARRFYDRLSRWYDLISGAELKLTTQAVELLDVKPGERVLDLGCGAGSGLAAIDQATGQRARLTGCDLSPRMLTVTQVKFKRNTGAAPGLVCADAASLPILSAACDAVLMTFVLELFDTPDIPRVLAECRRVLKPGGRLAVVALAKSFSPGAMERGYEWLHAHLEQLADCRPIYTSQFVRSADFEISQSVRGNLFGLPVDVLLAHKPELEAR